MISILLTSYKEPNTIGRAIDAFLNQNVNDEYEILVAAPDEETGNVVMQYSAKDPRVRWVKDERKGKPAALNLLFKEAKGNIFVLSDGDVYVSEDSVNLLTRHFKDPRIGAVCGRPISTSPRQTKFGYWSHLLTDVGGHATRVEKSQLDEFIACSGYLFAIRKVFDSVPEDALSEDAVMSCMIWQKGLTIAYEPEAKVFVKYPNNFRDWIIQKRRSTGGYAQLHHYFENPPEMRTFWKESSYGWHRALSYAQNPKETRWTLELFGARIYLWLRVFIDAHLKSSSLLDIWKPVESTK
jgi:cellulose synthase/poly-beta-1,6-N-acetylglucosamine synthase-like glycosyltransferase